MVKKAYEDKQIFFCLRADLIQTILPPCFIKASTTFILDHAMDIYANQTMNVTCIGSKVGIQIDQFRQKFLWD